jgi:hypothetical protein
LTHDVIVCFDTMAESASYTQLPRPRGGSFTMLRRVLEAAPVAALLAIAVAQPSAEAMGVPPAQSSDTLVLVARDRDRGDGRDSRRHHRRDNRDRWFGFGRPYAYGDYGDCGGLRWRRYRQCRER